MSEGMRYWLFKSEPFKWSFDHQKKAGDKGQEWDGVRNYQARNFMREMKAVMDVPNPVTLDAVKAEPALKDMVLVNNSRLSVQPVEPDEFRTVCEMGGLDPARAMGK